jgi:hypothetical protein
MLLNSKSVKALISAENICNSLNSSNHIIFKKSVEDLQKSYPAEHRFTIPYGNIKKEDMISEPMYRVRQRVVPINRVCKELHSITLEK